MILKHNLPLGIILYSEKNPIVGRDQVIIFVLGMILGLGIGYAFFKSPAIVPSIESEETEEMISF